MKIVAENLGKRFNREWIFRKLDFTFEHGNCYAIVGPNGSGKSTLLQVLWGQTPPSAGTVKYFNQQASIPIEEVYKSVVLATPYMELIEEFTLQEMVRFHFKFKKVLNGYSYNELLDIFELSHARQKQIVNFSSGMKQRLKLGLAFYSDTSSIFLDEPTTNLDKQATEWYRVNLNKTSTSRLVFIASNVEYEYPDHAQKIDLLGIK